MNRRAIFVFCLAAALCLACSSSSSGPAGPSFSQGHPPSETPPAHVTGGFSITLPDLTLKPGEEQQPCWIFPFTLTGPSHVVGGGTLTTTQGLHHGNITSRPKTGDGIRPCPMQSDTQIGGEALDVLAGGTVLFGSSTQFVGTEWQSFPPGMGYRVKDQGFEIVARMHYLNVTSQPLTLAPKYEWYTIDESTLTTELAPFAWELTNFSIPPHTQQTFAGSCNFPTGMHIVNVLPHMHKLGVEFDAAFMGGPLDGQKFLESPGYDPEKGVQQQYDPAIDLSQGNGMTMSCTWNNVTDQTVTEGVGNNEMCIIFGYAYPPAQTFSATIGGPEARQCAWIAQ